MDERIIDFEQVAEDGRQLKSYAVELYECLTEVQQLIKNTESSFDSEAGDAMRTKFNNSAKKFEEFRDVVSNYGEYLVTYADGQKERETGYITAITEGIGDL